MKCACLRTPSSLLCLCGLVLAVQMVSLLHLADINEEGVTFQSPTDGKRMLLTPEHSIQVSSTQAQHGVTPAAAMNHRSMVL